jgi:hypothetical protein
MLFAVELSCEIEDDKRSGMLIDLTDGELVERLAMCRALGAQDVTAPKASEG